MHIRQHTCLFFALCVLFAACGDDDTNPPATQTTASSGTSSSSTTSQTTSTGACSLVSQLPTGESPYLVAAAGAPLSYFGSEDAPTFDTAFDALNTVGFNAFFPWFGEQEVDGVASVSGHFDFWLPSEFTGPARSCASNNGRDNPYRAAEGRLKVIFPAFFFSDAQGDEAFDNDEFQRRYNLFRDACWGGDDSNIAAFQSFDELATRHIVSLFFEEPAPRLRNAPDAANLLHELSDVPVLLIEGPLPFVIEQEAGLSAEQKTALIEDFWQAVDQTTPRSDLFGFNIYPVETAPLTISADYVLEARQRAPQTQGVAVLQGFSYNAETGRRDPRRGPTATESRFMAIDAMFAGAPNLIWYGASALDLDREDDAQVWESVQEAVRLTQRVGPLLDLPTAEVAFVEPAGAFARTLDATTTALVVLNRSDAPLDGAWTLPSPVQYVEDAETQQRLEHDASATVQLSLDPWEVRLLLVGSCRVE